jgi:hypothetical protein
MMDSKVFRDEVAHLLITEWDFLPEEAAEEIDNSLERNPDLWEDEDLDALDVAEHIAYGA